MIDQKLLFNYQNVRQKMKEKKQRNLKISKLIIQQVSIDDLKDKKEIFSALEKLLNNKDVKYDFNLKISDFYTNLSVEKIDDLLSNFSEIKTERKKSGTYYTPNDVSNYIVINSFLLETNKKISGLHNFADAFNILENTEKEKLNDLIFKKKIIDPTCGSGEFLVKAAIHKLSLLEKKFFLNDNYILDIAASIYGNDINSESVDIAIYRLFMIFARKMKDYRNYKKLTSILLKNFTQYDLVFFERKFKLKYDIVVGNPPYVEYSKYKGKKSSREEFGNVYADVLYNSLELLKNNSVFGFVLPISYSSTKRMKRLRDIIEAKNFTQYVLSFADRPDCLFKGVHQKVNIVISRRDNDINKLYTSRYLIWNNFERKNLFNNISIISHSSKNLNYIPKFGNSIEKSIFKKLNSKNNNSLLSLQILQGSSVYLNTRAAFWVKAFSFNPGSKEYKRFYYEEKLKNFILSILNSSLYWFFWTVVSDGWHITNKELEEFYVPTQLVDYSKFDLLFNELERKLELTKKQVNSVQVNYEYKHKECKDIIDKIDEELSKIYNLTKKELDYIKNFSSAHRTGVKVC
jgi:hypothetical protein